MSTNQNDSEITKTILREAIKSLNYDPKEIAEFLEALKLEKEESKEEEIPLDFDVFFQPLTPEEPSSDVLPLSESNFGNMEGRYSESNLLKCLRNIQQVESLKGIFLYIQKLLEIFKSFRCDFHLAELFLQNLYEFTIAIGAPKTGIIFHINTFLKSQETPAYDILSCFYIPTFTSTTTPTQSGVPLRKKDWTTQEIRQLEETLDSIERYLKRLTHPECLEILVENDTNKYLDKLDSSLREFLHVAYVRNKNSIGPLDPLLNFKPITNAYITKNLVSTINSSPEELTEITNNITPSEATQLNQEIKWATGYLEALWAEVEVDALPHYFMPLTSPALKKFWLSRFDDANSVTVDSFLTAVGEEMNKQNYDITQTKTFLRLLSTALIDAISGPSPPIKDAKAEEESPTRFISVNDLARELNWVPMQPNDRNPIPHLQHFVNSSRNKLRRYAPCNPNVILYWNEEEDKNKLLGLLTGSVGWLVCNNTPYSGRSTTLLQLCYELPEDRDLVFLDLHHPTTEVEAMSMVCRQLGLLNCQSRQEFAIGLRKTLLKLRPNSVVVFDNLESKLDDNAFLQDFIGNIIQATQSLHNRLSFLVVGYSPELLTPIVPIKILQIPQLNVQNLSLIATELLPVDPEALLKAARGSVAMMYNISRCSNLKHIREVAQRLDQFQPEDDDPEVVAQATDLLISNGCIEQMTANEQIITACLLPSLSPFDIPLAWSLCEEAFEGDQIKWWIAWKSLLSMGWFYYRSLGYQVCPIAMRLPIPTLSSEGSEFFQGIWNKYYIFWGKELRRMYFSYLEKSNQGSSPEVALLVFQYFNMNLYHFKTIFSSFPVVIDDRLVEPPVLEHLKKGVKVVKAPPIPIINLIENLTVTPNTTNNSSGDTPIYSVKTVAKRTKTTFRLSPQNPSKIPCSFVEDLAGSVCGIISPLLSTHYTPTISLVILTSVRACTNLKIDLIRINTDIAEQLIRLDRHRDALSLLIQVERKYLQSEKDRFPLDATRLYFVRSQCLEVLGSTSRAIDDLKLCADLLIPLSATEDDPLSRSFHSDDIKYSPDDQKQLVMFYTTTVKRELKKLLANSPSLFSPNFISQGFNDMGKNINEMGNTINELGKKNLNEMGKNINEMGNTINELGKKNLGDMGKNINEMGNSLAQVSKRSISSNEGKKSCQIM